MNSFFSSGWGNSAFHSRGNSGYHFQEWDLGSSGIVNNDTAVQIGQLVGANAVVLGSITKIGETARINIRIVDVETARVESTASATLSGADFAEMYDQYIN
jgi:curli biogenesis system outer membrane secretion channel CsgG